MNQNEIHIVNIYCNRRIAYINLDIWSLQNLVQLDFVFCKSIRIIQAKTFKNLHGKRRCGSYNPKRTAAAKILADARSELSPITKQGYENSPINYYFYLISYNKVIKVPFIVYNKS